MDLEDRIKELTERASRGAIHLDTHSPGWYTLIDLDKLSMQHCTHCVMGQLSELNYGYWDLRTVPGTKPMDNNSLMYKKPGDPIVDLGFWAEEGQARRGIEAYAILQLAWTVEIQARRLSPEKYVPSRASDAALPPA